MPHRSMEIILGLIVAGGALLLLLVAPVISWVRAPHLYVAIAARFMPGRRVVSEETMTRPCGSSGASGAVIA